LILIKYFCSSFTIYFVHDDDDVDNDDDDDVDDEDEIPVDIDASRSLRQKKIQFTTIRKFQFKKMQRNNLNTVLAHYTFVNDHTTLKTPVLVRSPKLSNVGRS